MMSRFTPIRCDCRLAVLMVLVVAAYGSARAADEPHPVLTWVKRHPAAFPGVKGAKPSPRLGYETTYGYDPARRLLLRYGGHNQGGGGEQNSEVWTYDLDRDLWTLKEPNDAPPGVCCGQQNVFDEALRRFVRFPSFSGSHGWQSPREIALKDSSVWTYELDTNTWRAMRPCPEIWPRPLRGAAYDPELRLTVLHGGEKADYGTVVYDLYTNTWYAMKPPGGPPANLSQPGFAFDAVHRVFVLFGSQFHSDPQTWIYDLRTNRWQVLAVKEHPPADKSCPVLAADTRSGIVLCNVLGASGLETWALDVSKPAWTRLRVQQEPELSGARNRVLLYLPDRNLFVLENRTRDEQQIWTFRYAEAPLPAPRAEELRLTTEAQGARLSWKAPMPAEVRYTVCRGQGDKPWEVELSPVAETLATTTFEDRGLAPGTVYYYQVRTVDRLGRVLGRSPVISTRPPVVAGLVLSVLGPRQLELGWQPLQAEDVVGYHVERAEVAVYSAPQVKRIAQRYPEASETAVGRIKAIGPFRRLTAQPLHAGPFIDRGVDLMAGPREPAHPIAERPLPPDQLDPNAKPYRYATYAYRVVAVNRLGVESGPSPLVFSYPSAVQHVFAKEEPQGKTRLRWQPNPEKAIAGYHVYRHNGRWDKDPIVRLTARPIRATEFVDEQATESTRRYEIVAVDLLGQEGEPSQPVWSRREWKRFYEPYVGPWHQ